ncbi:hypothetical protein JCM3775_000883 [Rhodotorula graminis]|uniref:Ribonuclease H n=1 Tax=Rhodotorula graminis (strain WP1) TaxID=578459 RepID=A0A194S5D3_RHOGW|nr:uncharacterized protein RHOBADRAFT_52951 [Rhodotorula graminis WP1]KPV75943.1 hypothetical protein RHOBADRAFT_52951 [Rhodotorula graminis WP1]
MAKGTKGGFYAVRVGRKPGVYTSWDDCAAQVNGFQGARHKKFPTRDEAEGFVSGGAGPSSAASTSSSAPVVTSDKRNKRTSDAAGPVERAVKRQKNESAKAGPAARRVDPVFGAAGSSSSSGRRVYCDGSSRGNGKKGAVAGIGVFWGHDVGDKNLSERLPGKLQTNNRAEMYAVARILESDPHPDKPLTICSDSEYTIGVFSKWIPGWRRRGWKTSDGKPVANQDLIRYILSLLALRMPADSTSQLANITFHKVKAHVGIEGNEQADRFANNGAMMPKVADVDFAQATRDNERKLKERKQGAVKAVEDVEWSVDVGEGDLLDEDELKELEEKQAF